MPSAVEEEVVRQFHVKTVGRTEEIKERYYAISPERRLRNPAVVAISKGARSTIFAD
jgi:LysR family transcriptional activator of nhaA